MHTPEHTDSSRTDNGFYLGDKVEYTDRITGDRKESVIVGIVAKGRTAPTFDGKNYYVAPTSIVKLEDGTETLDLRLSRIR
jgi:hypothetical protein